MIHFEHYRSGSVYGIRYAFDHAGDALPLHAHPPELAHNVVVMRGAVALDVEGESTLLFAGDVCDFDWTKQHTVRALNDGAKVLHVFLNGMPEGYDRLPPEELKGTYG